MAGTLNLAGYKLTFDDEFNGFSASVWNTTYSGGVRTLSSNGELEYYSDASVGANPFSLQNGALVISARPSTNLAQSAGLPYTSGVITTQGSFLQEYGYFEMRAKLPAGSGLWPAFWMLSQGQWPPELDALEAFGAPNAQGEGGPTLYHVGTISKNGSQSFGTWVDAGVNLLDSYHRYGISWDAQHLTYYIDGRQVAQTTTPADANVPMYLIANLAVGGNWPGAPNGSTVFPANMSIDYIRAYSADANAGAVALQTISSPDGIDTTPGGVIVAGGVTPSPSPGPSPSPTPAGTPSTIKIFASEDAFDGDAQFTLTADGHQIGSTYTVTTAKSSGQWQEIDVSADLGSLGPQQVTVAFINDAWDGGAPKDRNLYIQRIEVNGKVFSGTSAVNNASGGATQDFSAPMYGNGTLVFTTAGSVPTATPNHAPVVSGVDRTLTHNATLAASSLFSTSDADGDAIQKYQLSDDNAAATSGHLVLDGAAQPAITTVEVAAAQLGQLSFQAGTAGTDHVSVRAFDGTDWSAWKQIALSVAANHAPIVGVADLAMAKGQTLAGSSLFSVSDADGDVMQTYRFWDDNTNGHFVVNGQVQGAHVNIDVAAAQLANTSFVTGPGSDRLWVQVYDGIDWSQWKPFTVSAQLNRAPVVSAVDLTAAKGQTLAASSLFSVSDADGDAMQAYRFWDDNTNGHFVVNGQAQGAHVNIDVAAAQLASTSFVTGPGSDRLWVQVYDGADWSQWKPFTVSAPLNHAPVVNAVDITSAKGQTLAALSLFSVSDADGDAMQTYRFWDDNTNGHFVVNGQAQGAHVNIDVAAAQLASTSFVIGPGSDRLWIQVYDGTAWSQWKPFTVSAPLNHAPVVSAADEAVQHSAPLAASSLFSVADADGDAIQKYQFWDSTASSASGHFVVAGQAQGANVAIDVAAGQLAQTVFQTGWVTDQLWVRAFDGADWSAWQAFKLTTSNAAPIVTAPDQTVAANATIAASSLFSVVDADGDAIQRYQFWDDLGSAAGGHFAVGGVAQRAGVTIDVAAAQLAQTSFVAGTAADHLWVRAFDGSDWSAWQGFNVTPTAAAHAADWHL